MWLSKPTRNPRFSGVSRYVSAFPRCGNRLSDFGSFRNVVPALLLGDLCRVRLLASSGITLSRVARLLPENVKAAGFRQ